MPSNIHIWLQGRDGHNNICFTKEEYINSSLSRNVDLLLHLNHFKLLIKNSTEQNGFHFQSTSIGIQQKSNEDSFSKLNKIIKNKISKGKKHEKRKQPQEKSSISGKKIKPTKSNTNVEQKNPTQKNMPEIIPNNIEIPISESHNSLNSDFEICHSISKKEHELRQKCRQVGINLESRTQIENENENEMSKILKKNYDKLRYKLKTLGLNLENIPEAPELTNDTFPSHASL